MKARFKVVAETSIKIIRQRLEIIETELNDLRLLLEENENHQNKQIEINIKITAIVEEKRKLDQLLTKLESKK